MEGTNAGQGWGAEYDSLTEEQEDRLLLRELLSADVEEFFNQSHGKDGRFDVGPDGPGRVRDKDISVLPSGSPEFLKNLLRRRIARTQQATKLPAKAPKYLHEMLKRKISQQYGGGK